MTYVTLPRAGMPLTGDLTISREWYRWARDITERSGGVAGASSNDLSLSQFEDAGIEEVKLGLYRLTDEVNSQPQPAQTQIDQLTTEVNQLRDCVAVLMQSLQDMQQGTML